MSTKKAIHNQQYEKYWELTLEYSDFMGIKFNNVLKIIVDYIDKYVDEKIGITSEEYRKLQNIIEKVYPKKDSASTRKSINQFLKLGFINNKASSYHPLTRSFLEEKDEELKRILYSKIVYDNSSFSRSVSKFSNTKEIQFLVNTLENCGKITKDELLALMFTDVDNNDKGYLTKEEIAEKLIDLSLDETEKRKYNQRNFIFKLCSNLTGIYVNENIMSINEDIMDKKEKNKVRDPYLQRLYKHELMNEVIKKYHLHCAECMLEHFAYPVLIASHIKPYHNCDSSEEFDKDNGLLLSKNMDSLFDLGYITFDDNGNVITSHYLDTKIAEYVKKYKLDDIIYNDKRKKYMDYHRKNVFRV